MNINNILEELAEQEGWSDETQKLLLIGFLEEKTEKKELDSDELEQYLQDRIFDTEYQ